MATNKRDLRAYVRYDGTGRIIPGSLVLRRSKPKVGDWKEIQTYECCDGGGTTCTLTSPATAGLNFPAIGVGINMNASSCGGGMSEFAYSNLFVDSIPAINSIADLIQTLNENLSFYGTFSSSPTGDINLKLSNDFSFICTCQTPLSSIMVIYTL